MQRKFNYTGRVRLQRADVRFSLRPGEGDGRQFDADLQLDGYDLPADALVSVEAYRQTTWMRFNFGVVGALQPPADLGLHEFDSGDDILFRVRVTSPGTPDDPHGLLLAEADRIPLVKTGEREDSRQPLFPVVPADLGDELWQVNFTDHPRLLVNQAAGNYKQIGLDPGFVATVYPAALREVLGRILREEHRDYHDPDDWRSRWLRFAVEVLGVGEPPEVDLGDFEVVDEWIAAAVNAFARKHGLLEKFKTSWGQEGKDL